jgi:hypothetical protein
LFPTVKSLVDSEFFPEALFSKIKHEGSIEIIAMNSVAPDLFVKYTKTINAGTAPAVQQDQYMRVHQVNKHDVLTYSSLIYRNILLPLSRW